MERRSSEVSSTLFEEALEEGDGVIAGQGEGGGLDGLAHPTAQQKAPQGEAQTPAAMPARLKTGFGTTQLPVYRTYSLA